MGRSVLGGFGVNVTVFVHPVDTDRNPSVPPGWRWAVHVGDDPQNMRTCMNAGWCPGASEAAMEGEMVGVTVAKALRFAGVPTNYRAVRRLDSDPCPPAGLDTVSVG